MRSSASLDALGGEDERALVAGLRPYRDPRQQDPPLRRLAPAGHPYPPLPGPGPDLRPVRPARDQGGRDVRARGLRAERRTVGEDREMRLTRGRRAVLFVLLGTVLLRLRVVLRPHLPAAPRSDPRDFPPPRRPGGRSPARGSLGRRRPLPMGRAGRHLPGPAQGHDRRRGPTFPDPSRREPLRRRPGLRPKPPEPARSSPARRPSPSRSSGTSTHFRRTVFAKVREALAGRPARTHAVQGRDPRPVPESDFLREPGASGSRRPAASTSTSPPRT